MRAALFVTVLSTCTWMPLTGCRQPPAPARDAAVITPRPEAPPKITVREGGGLLFSFFDHRAELRTVERRDQVPEAARREVMVTDPRRALPGDTIWLADLRTQNKTGEFKVWVERKGSWLDRVTPKTSQLRSAVAAAPKPVKKAVKKKRPVPRKVAQKKGEPPGPKVILFSTAWCPSCKTARQYFITRNIRFVELDVEKDPQAGQQYQAITNAYHLRPGVVPLIIVNGRPMQGFSQQQVEAALATPAQARAP